MALTRQARRGERASLEAHRFPVRSGPSRLPRVRRGLAGRSSFRRPEALSCIVTAQPAGGDRGPRRASTRGHGRRRDSVAVRVRGRRGIRAPL